MLPQQPAAAAIPADEQLADVQQLNEQSRQRAELDSVVYVEQEYVVVAGDAMAMIAQRFGVQLDVLAAYNEWPEGITHPLFPGEVVRIPPGAMSVPPCSCEVDGSRQSD